MQRRWQNPRQNLLTMQPTTRRAICNAANLLTATPDEAAIIIAAALGSAADLLHLAAACRRFALKCIAAPSPPRATASGSSAAAAAQQAEMWSIAEEVARRWIVDCTDQERGWVPRRGRESWLGLMWEVEVLRRGAVFGRSHAEMTLSEGGALATIGGTNTFRTAASKAVMRAGRHYAQFTVVSGTYMMFGVIRPGWDVEGAQDAQRVDGHCFYYTYYRVGLLLDLDQGTMTVYQGKNDERLGVMATGLSGEYSWAVSLILFNNSVRIEAAEAPVSPSAEELKQAAAWMPPVHVASSD